ncbi:VWA domain-containing protein [Streptomyces angustmyceticus]|uniref:VWA domain-containing protein n=1 Tax=Streptomyces angustmyceticus TaxID=285578 RepID=UPI0021AF3060|nr:VWA domain-containing protein [Streptomyces angustmyceticus]
MTTSLLKGQNAALMAGQVTFTVAAAKPAVDVSALLLGSNGKVRRDNDLVFYNHPAQDGVQASGHTVTADLDRIPSSVATVVLVASVDPLQPGAVFTTAPRVSITQAGTAGMAFIAPDFAARETVVVLAELYRRGDGWKVRAVGQGYASGLAGLATDYGVDIDDDAATSTPPAGAVPAQAGPVAGETVNLSKIQRQAPALLEPARQAGQALMNRGIANRRAAVYLILDHDYQMEEMYESFAVQAFAERVLALSANLDDDGTVPVVFSSGEEPFLEEIRLDNYRGRIGQLHTQVDWGWGNVADAMRRTVDHYQESGAADPAFVIVQVGDEPWDKSDVRSLLQNTATLGVFWLFVGFGRGKLAFYKNLNASASASFSNVAFYDASKNPGSVPGDRFYTGLIEAFGKWMKP